MVNVVIAGLPSGVKLLKVMSFVKRAVLRCRKDLHVNYFKQTSDSFKQLSFSTKFNQALKAKHFLDGFVFIYAKEKYPLKCWLENLDEDQIEYQPRQPRDFPQTEEDVEVNYEPPPKSFRYSNSPVRSRSRSRSRARSRSPHYSSELKAIEFKIELIKKQRILMEEETKLLLEKRKLEYLQNLGSNNIGKLAKFEEVNRRNDASEISDFLASAEPSRVKPKKLPMFIKPCKEICFQMKPLVNDHSGINSHNATIFWNLLRSTLKKRLTIIVEGKAYLPTKAIVGLYRAKHPQTTDQSLIDRLLNTINTSFWPRKSNVAQPASDIAESQTTEAENPPADAEEIDSTETTQHERENAPSSNQCVDLDDFVGDMENDFENWDDETETNNAQDNVGESLDSEEQLDVTKTNMAEERELAAITDSTFEDVDEAVLIVDDANRTLKVRETEGL